MTAMAGLYAGNVRAVLERGFKVIGNQNWTIVVSGFFEPVFYLLAMGIGLGALVGAAVCDAAQIQGLKPGKDIP